MSTMPIRFLNFSTKDENGFIYSPGPSPFDPIMDKNLPSGEKA